LGDSDAEGGDKQYATTANALSWRLSSVLDQPKGIFDDFEHLKLNELFRPGRCSILQLNEINEKEQQVMVATLLRHLFRARSQTEKQQVAEGDALYLPYPVFVLIEEAHHFAPASSDVISTHVLKQILAEANDTLPAEGRKFGVGVGLISQRPGKLDSDVLSQCNTQFLLRIVNPIDQKRVAESVETVGRNLLRELPALTKGQVIVAGAAVNTPLLCQVRRRHTPYGGETKSAPKAWARYEGAEEQARREREAALPFVAVQKGKSIFK
jgi:DNA helicase HerA-like ATPase